MLLTVSVANAGQPTNNGFDEFGYNRIADNFVGTGMSWCMGKVGNASWCESYLGGYADDKLKMTWNDEWNRGNEDGWDDPDGYYGAWTDNLWNGMGPNGSGETWHYRYRWIGDCGADRTPTPNGGYCIWGQFEVISSHGTYGDSGHMIHLWDVSATPGGYGGGYQLIE